MCLIHNHFLFVAFILLAIIICHFDILAMPRHRGRGVGRRGGRGRGHIVPGGRGNGRHGLGVNRRGRGIGQRNPTQVRNNEINAVDIFI